MVNCQTKLEEVVEAMSQEIGTIKQLVERLVVPRAPTTTRGKTDVEGRPRVVMQPQASHELSASPPFTGRIYPLSCTKQEKDAHQGWTIQTSQQNSIGPPTEVRRLQGSQEKEHAGVAPKSSHNVFDRLGHNAEEDYVPT